MEFEIVLDSKSNNSSFKPFLFSRVKPSAKTEIMNKNFLIAGLSLVIAFSAASCARRVVVVKPPAPRVEVIPVAPSPRHVWVKGYYKPRGRHYVWVPGHYVVRRR